MDWRFVKGYGFLSFAKNMDKSNGKNTSKSMSGKCRNFLIMPSNQLRIHLKLLQKEQFKKKAEATGELIGNKIANEAGIQHF